MSVLLADPKVPFWSIPAKTAPLFLCLSNSFSAKKICQNPFFFFLFGGLGFVCFVLVFFGYADKQDGPLLNVELIKDLQELV